ncbi:MAG TPA: response regulator [Verrucomicrobiae bacterium]|nr:response regulator [Verrucomicrobiae bacterium]
MAQKSKKILVVEDDVTMREIVVQKLKSSGYNVVEAEDGAKGIKLATKEKPDLILLDLMLPEVDGFGVLKEVRANKDENISKTPVIILSNLWSKEEIIKTKELGVQAYIIKAYMTTEEILEKVNDVLKQTQEASPPSPKSSK